MRHLSTLLILLILCSAATAAADTLDKRLGIYGKAGAVYPLQDDFVNGTDDSETTFATGGGLIFGLNPSLALELDVSYVPQMDLDIGGSKGYEAEFTDVALGMQYRFTPESRLVPYLGAGVDFITGDLEHVSGTSYDLDWTVGGHVSAGLDFFLNRGIALNVEVRGILAPEGDVEAGDSNVAEYDPSSIIATVGLRLFLPESTFR